MGKRRNPKDPPKAHQFKPGQSGNPGGVAGGKRISTWLIELGQMTELPDADTLPMNGRIALARIKSAMEPGGERSTEIILDRTEGKQTDIKLLTPPAPEMTPEEKAEIMAELEKYSQPVEIVYCLGCKGIHAGGGPGCDYAGRGITKPASVDPLTGYAYDPDYHPEIKYSLLTGDEIKTTPGEQEAVRASQSTRN